MAVANKANKTFSLDKSVLDEVKRTKGSGSESERVNRLLKIALEGERRAALYQEAARFFSEAPDDREERSGYEDAAVSSWVRE